MRKKKINVISIIYVSLAVIFFASIIILNNVKESALTDLLSVLCVLFVMVAFFITALVDGCLYYTDKKRKILTGFICIGNALWFILLRLIPKDFTTAFSLLLNTGILVYFISFYFLHKTNYPESQNADLKHSTVFAMLMPWLMLLMMVEDNYCLDEGLLFTYVAIFAGIIAVIFAILSLTVFRKTYAMMATKWWIKLLVVLGAIMFIFFYSFIAVSCVNAGFSSQRQEATYEIIDKRVSASARSTEYSITIIYNEKEIDVSVSYDVYNSKEKGDMVIIYTYKGFLSIPYLASAE